MCKKRVGYKKQLRVQLFFIPPSVQLMPPTVKGTGSGCYAIFEFKVSGGSRAPLHHPIDNPLYNKLPYESGAQTLRNNPVFTLEAGTKLPSS